MNKHISAVISILVSWGLFAIMPVMSQNAPISSIGIVNSYTSTATVPVSATNISNVGSFSLKILYDQAIVHPVAVTTNPLLGGNISVNLNNPGVIFMSWYTYPGLTLSGNPVIFNIDFTRLATGTSLLTWLDDGYSCAWYDASGVVYNDVPAATYYVNGSVTFNSTDAPHTIMPVVQACHNTVVNVPVRISNFNNIGKVSLTLNYTSASLAYQDYINTSGFPGLVVDGTIPGTLTISGIIPAGGPGLYLPDSSSLVILNFTYSGGSAGLGWVDNGASCQYTGCPPAYFILNDTPQSGYYINGSITETALPVAAGAITGPPGGNVCPGQSAVNFNVPPVQNASAYVWSLPPGAVITNGELTNNIVVTFGSNVGNSEITVYGNNACGNGPVSPSFPIYINEPPAITTQPVSPAIVNTGAGSASFTVGTAGSLLSFQWQEFITSWMDLFDGGVYEGALTSTLTIIDPPASMDSNHYRCIVSGFCPPQAISNGEAMLAVSSVSEIKDNYGYDKYRPLNLNVTPNPAVQEINLNYFLPENGYAVLEIRNMAGEKMGLLFSGNETRGNHKLKKALHFNPGLYLVTLTLQTETAWNSKSVKLIMQ